VTPKPGAPKGPLSTGPAVVLTDHWLVVVRQAVLAAAIRRNRNGLPESTDYSTLLDALTSAMARTRQCDVAPPPDLPPLEPEEHITVEEAAKVLGKSRRQVQRQAALLGGHLVGGRWLLDRTAVEEHREGVNRG
jgi:excisionase family DNA binding protein